MVDDAALEDFAGLTDVKEEEKNAVVIGLAPNMFNYSELNKAFRWVYLQHSNLLVGTTYVTRLEVLWAVINKVTVFGDVSACSFEDG